MAVFAKDAKAAEAAAGGDIVGADDLAEEVMKGNINFDYCIATPDSDAFDCQNRCKILAHVV